MQSDVPEIERKIKKHTTIATFILTIALIILFSEGTSINIGSLFNGRFFMLVATENIQIFSCAFVVIIAMLGLVRIRINDFNDLFWLLLPFILTILSLFSQMIETQKSNNMNVQTIVHIFIMFFLICFIKQIKIIFYDKVLANFIVIIGFLEAILGIFQHVTGNTIFDPQPLNAVYFFNGMSSSNIADLGFGASVRAFGTFDSGLTLGIFLIFSLAIMLDLSSLNIVFKIVFFITYLIGIYSTLTRNVYIGFIVFILVYILLTFDIKSLYIKWLYFIVTVISAALFWLTNLLYLLVSVASNVNITTFGTRFIFLKQIMAEIPDTLHFLFGNNITSANGIPIDNSAITIIAQFGLIFAILVVLLQISIFNSTISNKLKRKSALGAFLFLFPVMGASNNVVQSFLVAAALISLFNDPDQEVKKYNS